MANWEYLTMSYKSHYGRTDYVINGEKDARLKDKELAEVMNMLGSQGWELAAVTDPETHELVFKRQKQANNSK